MDVRVQALDATARNTALLASAGSSTSAWLVFGVSMWIAISAFAGAALILSFLPRRDGGRVRTILTVAFCTMLGILAAPLVVKKFAVLGDATELTAFSIAAIAQILLPGLVEYRKEILDWAFGLLPGKRKDKRDPDKPEGGR